MDPKDLGLRLAALEKEVPLLRAGRAPTIRTSGRCPACGGRAGIEIDGEKVLDASASKRPEGGPYR